MIDVEVRADRRRLGIFRDADRVLAEGTRWFLDRAAQEAARELRRDAPKAQSNYVNSITVRAPGALERAAGPTVEHAVYVERGTEGGAQRPMPPVSALLDWVQVRALQPRDPQWTQRDLAWAIARAIQSRGTPPNPVVRRLREDPAFRARLRALAAEGQRRAFDGRA